MLPTYSLVQSVNQRSLNPRGCVCSRWYFLGGREGWSGWAIWLLSVFSWEVTKWTVPTSGQILISLWTSAWTSALGSSCGSSNVNTTGRMDERIQMTANLIAHNIIIKSQDIQGQCWPSTPWQENYWTEICPALFWFFSVVLSAEQLLSQNQEPPRHHSESLVTWENLDLFKMIRYDSL